MIIDMSKYIISVKGFVNFYPEGWQTPSVSTLLVSTLNTGAGLPYQFTAEWVQNYTQHDKNAHSLMWEWMCYCGCVGTDIIRIGSLVTGATEDHDFDDCESEIIIRRMDGSHNIYLMRGAYKEEGDPR